MLTWLAIPVLPDSINKKNMQLASHLSHTHGGAAVLICAIGLATSVPQQGYNNILPSTLQLPSQYAEAPAQYEFQYGINDPFSGNFYGHAEAREGTQTQGSYFVQLPDSRLMKVEYYADEYGYHPTITYEGEALYPPTPAELYAQHGLASPAPAPAKIYSSQPRLAPGRGPITAHLPNQFSQPTVASVPIPSQQYSLPRPVSSISPAPGPHRGHLLSQPIDFPVQNQLPREIYRKPTLLGSLLGY